MLANIANRGVSSTEFWGLLAGIYAIIEFAAPPWPVAVMVSAYVLGRSIAKAFGDRDPAEVPK